MIYELKKRGNSFCVFISKRNIDIFAVDGKIELFFLNEQMAIPNVLVVPKNLKSEKVLLRPEKIKKDKDVKIYEGTIAPRKYKPLSKEFCKKHGGYKSSCGCK